MKKHFFLLACTLCTIFYADAHVAAKSSHYNLINEMRKNPSYSYSYDDLVDALPETPQNPHETLIGFERRMEKELKKQREMTELLDKKLRREREELVCNINQAKQRLAKHIMKTEEELGHVSSQGEQKIKEFDIHMQNQLQKQENVCAQLHKNMMQAKKQLALNIAQAEEDFLNTKRSYELQDMAECLPDENKQEVKVVEQKPQQESLKEQYKELRNIQDYLVQNQEHLQKKADILLKEYKNKRKLNDRNILVNGSIKRYISELNEKLTPLTCVPEKAQKDPEAKKLIESIQQKVHPLLATMHELFDYEASSLKPGHIKKVQIEPLSALYSYIKQPLQTVGSNANAQKNLSDLDATFMKLGIPRPH